MNISWSSHIKPDEIFFSNEFEQGKPLIDKKIRLHFGTWNKVVKARESSTLTKDTIGLSSKMIKTFHIPTQLSFEIKIENSDLYIGPIIALMVTMRQKITQKTLDKYKPYMQNYQQIKGLIYICSARGTDIKKKIIKGYYYDPDVGEKEECWKPGIFPYPNSIYKRTRIPHLIFKDLISEVGNNKIFNTTIFNKWQLWKMMKSDPELKKHLPKTSQLKNLKSLNLLLDKYPSLYLKPAQGSFAKGISKVEKTETGYRFINRLGKETVIDDEAEAERFLQRLMKRKVYIIQEDVSFQHKGKNIDFRVIMQKDRNKEWTCSGIIARYGGHKRIYTNDVSDLQLGKDALTKTYQYSEEEALAKEMEIITICKKASETMNALYGHYGDLGVDITVDKNHHVWILEINHFAQVHKIASLVTGAPELYGKVVTTPFEYAKSIAGF